MKATVCVGLLIVTCCEPFTAMNMVIDVGTSVEDTPNWNALPRTLVTRITRVPEAPGASIGTPRNTTELGLACRPENTFASTIPSCGAHGLGYRRPTNLPASSQA